MVEGSPRDDVHHFERLVAFFGHIVIGGGGIYEAATHG